MTTHDRAIPYSATELRRQSRARTYPNTALDLLRFPLGGMGAGGCRLDGHGRLVDWRLADTDSTVPNLGVQSTITVKRGGKAATWTGELSDSVAGFTAAFPVASLAVQAQELEGRLEALSPFIPQDAAATGLPVAMLWLHLHNPGDTAVTVAWQLRPSLTSTKVSEPLPGLAIATPQGVLQIVAPGAKSVKSSTTKAHLAVSARIAPDAEVALPVWLVWGPDDAAVAGTLATLTRAAAEMEAQTREFARQLHASTVPDIVRDAVAAQLADLQAASGTGLAESSAMPYFFSALSRQLHDRMPTGGAVDRQLAAVLRLYGDWLLCGDDDWLAARWPDVRSTLEGLAHQWDPEHHGVIDGDPPADCIGDAEPALPVVNGLYLAALRASEEMALQLADDAAASRYRRAFEQGRSWMEAVMFSGQWFRADADAQSPGPCIADQLLGQAYAGQWKLGYLMEREMIIETLESIFTHNWQSGDPRSGELGGLCLCTWPAGGAPPGITCRADAWPGAEYALAGLMIQQHLLDQGLALVKTTRDRCDGVHGNPWPSAHPRDCHAVRPLAAYGVMLALMDFFYSAPARTIHFAPKLYTDDFACVFAVDGAWGVLRQLATGEQPEISIEVLGGALELDAISIGESASGASIELGGEVLSGHGESIETGTIIRLSTTATLTPGLTLTATLLPATTTDDAFFADTDDDDD